MAARAANVKGISFLIEPLGSEKGGVAEVTFDLIGVPFTGGTDTITLGGGGQDNGVTTTLTLAQIMQNRRRDGKTVVLTGVSAASVAPGAQAAATNGPNIYCQAAALSGTTNLAGITLQTVPGTGGSNITTTTAAWDRAAALIVTYTAT